MGAGNKAAAVAILGMCGGLLLAGCNVQSGSVRTRASAEAAADVALARHEAASVEDRETLADMAAAACSDLDDGKTGSDIASEISEEATAIGLDLLGQLVFTQIIGTLVEEHCPDNLELWRR